MTMNATAPAVPAAPPAPAADNHVPQTPPTTSKPRDAVAAQTPPTKVEPEKRIRVRGYERAARVKAEMAEKEGASKEESTSEPDAERPSAAPQRAKPAAASASDSGAEKPKSEAKPEPKPDPEADERAKIREERNKRIAEIQAREAAAREKRAAQQKDHGQSAEIEKLRKRVAELEPHAEVFKDEETLLAAAEARGMSAEKLVQWMRTRLSNPEAVVQRQQQTAEQKFQAELDAIRKQLADSEQRREAEAQAARDAREGVERATRFVSMAGAETSSRTHPLTAAFLRARGEDHLLALASSVIVPHLPDNYGLDHLHDSLEQYLEYVTVGPLPAVPSASVGQTPPKTNGAAKPVTTLTNDLASARESVAEDIPLARLPRSERIARVKRRESSANDD